MSIYLPWRFQTLSISEHLDEQMFTYFRRNTAGLSFHSRNCYRDHLWAAVKFLLVPRAINHKVLEQKKKIHSLSVWWWCSWGCLRSLFRKQKLIHSWETVHKILLIASMKMTGSGERQILIAPLASGNSALSKTTEISLSSSSHRYSSKKEGKWVEICSLHTLVLLQTGRNMFSRKRLWMMDGIKQF